MTIKKVRKWFAFGLGIVVAFGAFEVTLRAIGFVENFRRSSTIGEQPKKPGEYVIVALGNSHTQGAGSDPGHAFTDYLQHMIDADPIYSQKQIRVVNRGRGNLNTTEILRQLQQWLDYDQPDVAVLMIGEPNMWNKSGYNRYLSRIQQKNRKLQLMSETEATIYDALYRSRVFRFAAMIYEGVAERMQRDNGERRSLVFPDIALTDTIYLGYKWMGALDNGVIMPIHRMTLEQKQEAIDVLERFVETSEGKHRLAYHELGLLYQSINNYTQTAKWWRKSFELDNKTFDFNVYATLRNRQLPLELQKVRDLILTAHPGGKILSRSEDFWQRSGGELHSAPPSVQREHLKFVQKISPFRPEYVLNSLEIAQMQDSLGDTTGAMLTLIRQIQNNPFTYWDVYNRFLTYRYKSSDQNGNAVVDAFIADYRKRFPQESHRMDQFLSDQIGTWVRDDLTEVVRILKRNGVRFVLQTYPPHRHDFGRVQDQVIQELASQNGYPLANNVLELEKTFTQSGDREGFYSNKAGPLDNHMNDRGNEEVAKILFTALKDNHLLPK